MVVILQLLLMLAMRRGHAYGDANGFADVDVATDSAVADGDDDKY